MIDFEGRLKELSIVELKDNLEHRGDFTDEAIRSFETELKRREDLNIHDIEEITVESTNNETLSGYGIGLVVPMKFIAVAYSLLSFFYLLVLYVQVNHPSISMKLLVVIIFFILLAGLVYFISYIVIKFYENIARIGMNTDKTNKLLEELLKH